MRRKDLLGLDGVWLSIVTAVHRGGYGHLLCDAEKAILFRKKRDRNLMVPVFCCLRFCDIVILRIPPYRRADHPADSGESRRVFPKVAVVIGRSCRMR